MGVIDRIASAVLFVVLAGVTIALVAGIAFEQPVLLAYIETGSMEPTIRAGDGYVPIPSILVGGVSEGDVVTFDAETIGDGGLTTHRVVGVTEEGYITQGDANMVTDQDGGEPYVSDGQVVAVALQINGWVVRIPNAGTAADHVGAGVDTVQEELAIAFGTDLFRGDRGLAVLLFGFGVAVFLAEYAVSDARSRESRSRTRSGERIKTSYVVGGMAIILMVAATMGMLGPAGTTTFELVSSQSDPDTPRVVQAGGESERHYAVSNPGTLPVHVYLVPASGGVTIPEERMYLERGTESNLSVITHAPEELGFYTRSVREYRYLGILPGEVIYGLAAIHPMIPVVVINAMVGASTVLVGYGLFSGDTIRMRSRSRGGLFSSR